ncbi:MAG: hypothetical protein AB1813_12640 [Verrucomicrobiota bacterium]|jgi:hypothetical protein
MNEQNLSRPNSQMRRRNFLKIGATALASAAAWNASAQQPAASRRRRIGFVDDNLNNYHANVFLQAMRGPLKQRGFEVSGATGLKAAESRAWAEKNQVPWFDTAAALNDAVDFFMVLAPSTPETHLDLCRSVLPFKKPTYVDKTFAPDLSTGEKIFALADEHGAAMQTSSALRYTNIQEQVKKLAPATIEHMVTWGNGSSFGEYAIHPVELLISVMGPEATHLMRRGPSHRSQLLINFTGERTAVVNVYTQSNTNFAANVTTSKESRFIEVEVGKIFENTLAAILDFFEAGKALIDRRETRTILRMLDAARNPRAMKEFVSLA